jgi:hypothetical protein
MPVYTVHEPPLPAGEILADPERFIFVRDGFYWWAFLLAPFWMLRHRLWLVLLGYVVVTVALQTTLRTVGAPPSAAVVVAVLISLLVGLEAGTLRRITLKRRGWHNVGIVSGDDLEDAEQRFFAAWVRDPAARASVPPVARPAASGAASSQHANEESGVIGSFPEPGVSR